MNKERKNIDCAESSLRRSRADRWLGQRNVGWTVMGTRGAGECGCGHRKERAFKPVEGGLLYPKGSREPPHLCSCCPRLSPLLLPASSLCLSRSILSSSQRD